MPDWREGGDGYVGIFIFETFVPNIWSNKGCGQRRNHNMQCRNHGVAPELHFCRRARQILDRRMSLQIDHAAVYIPDSVTAMA